MRTRLTVATVVAVAAALAGLPAAGCHSKSSTAPESVRASSGESPASAPAQPADYAGLLIPAADINAPEKFTADPPILNPDGRDGVMTTFHGANGFHSIVDTILILPDPAAATAELDAAKGTVPGTIRGEPASIEVGTGGTVVSGDSPDGGRGLTMLRFTTGRAFVTLEFDGPPAMSAPNDFVTDVGRKQDAAIKDGLPG